MTLKKLFFGHKHLIIFATLKFLTLNKNNTKGALNFLTHSIIKKYNRKREKDEIKKLYPCPIPMCT